MSSMVWFTWQEKREENKVIAQNFEKRFGFMKETSLEKVKNPFGSVED